MDKFILLTTIINSFNIITFNCNCSDILENNIINDNKINNNIECTNNIYCINRSNSFNNENEECKTNNNDISEDDKNIQTVNYVQKSIKDRIDEALEKEKLNKLLPEEKILEKEYSCPIKCGMLNVCNNDILSNNNINKNINIEEDNKECNNNIKSCIVLKGQKLITTEHYEQIIDDKNNVKLEKKPFNKKINNYSKLQKRKLVLFRQLTNPNINSGFSPYPNNPQNSMLINPRNNNNLLSTHLRQLSYIQQSKYYNDNKNINNALYNNASVENGTTKSKTINNENCEAAEDSKLELSQDNNKIAMGKVQPEEAEELKQHSEDNIYNFNNSCKAENKPVYIDVAQDNDIDNKTNTNVDRIIFPNIVQEKNIERNNNKKLIPIHFNPVESSQLKHNNRIKLFDTYYNKAFKINKMNDIKSYNSENRRIINSEEMDKEQKDNDNEEISSIKKEESFSSENISYSNLNKIPNNINIKSYKEGNDDFCKSSKNLVYVNKIEQYKEALNNIGKVNKDDEIDDIQSNNDLQLKENKMKKITNLKYMKESDNIELKNNVPLRNNVLRLSLGKTTKYIKKNSGGIRLSFSKRNNATNKKLLTQRINNKQDMNNNDLEITHNNAIELRCNDINSTNDNLRFNRNYALNYSNSDNSNNNRHYPSIIDPNNIFDNHFAWPMMDNINDYPYNFAQLNSNYMLPNNMMQRHQIPGLINNFRNNYGCIFQ